MAGWVLLVAVVLGGPWVLAGLALHRARRAERRLEFLERQLLAPSPPSFRADAATAAAPYDSSGAGPDRVVPGATSAAPGEVPSPPAARSGAPAAPAPPVWEPPELATVPLPRPDRVATGGVDASTTRAPAPPSPSASLEERVALVGFARIGAAVFLLGAAYFFKYAVDNAWIGPAGRVGLGLLTGLALLVAGERLAPRARVSYVHALLGTGIAVLLAALFASHALYALLPVSLAFGGVAVVSLLGGALALRHRGELVLGLSLLGALLAPVLLSRGEDRPASLFGYLALVGALALWAAARAGFRAVPWAALLGPALLFAGWYDRWYDATPATPAELDLPGGPAGPYFALGARWAPLAAVGLFLALWLAHARAARRRGAPERLALGFEVAALLAAHLGGAALLLDRPWALGLALALLGAAGVLTLRRAGRPELLGLLLAAAFLALLASASASHAALRDPLPALAVLAAWAGLYAAAFLAAPGAERGAGRPLAHALTGAAGAALLVVSAVLLGERPVILAGVALLVGAGLAGAALARRAPGLLAGGGALAALALLRAASTVRPPATAHPVLALGALWALLAAAAAARAPRAPRFARLALAGAAAPGVGLLALTLVATRPSEPLLRAAGAGLAGALELGLGVLALRAATRASGQGSALAAAPRATALRPASLLLGVALALFAAALAFLLSGATLTVAWAVLAAVVAHLAAGWRDRDGVLGALALSGAALLRALTVDLAAGERAVARLVATRALEGAAALRPVLNERSLGLAAAGVAALLSARALARAAPAAPPRPAPAVVGRPWACLGAIDPFRAGAAGLVAGGHLALLALVAAEAVDLVVAWPAAPIPGSAAAVRAWQAARVAALGVAEGRQNVALTLVMGAYAAALVGAGFAARERVHRWLGLGLFALTLLKLALHDIWSLARPYQVAVLLGVGALLLGASFLYARHGARLLALLGAPPGRTGEDGPGTPGAPAASGPGQVPEAPPGHGTPPGGAGPLLLLALALGAPAVARALHPGAFASAAPIDGVSAPGLWRFEAPPELYAASRAGEEEPSPERRAAPLQLPGAPHATDLRDLRVEGPDGAEVAFVLRTMGPVMVSGRVTAALLDPVRLPAGGARAVLDLGLTAPRHDAVTLELAGETFLRRVRVESSADGRRWGELTQGRVWRVPATEPGAGSTIRYPVTDARYLRVTLLPGEGAVRIAGGAVRRAATDTPLPWRERKAGLLFRAGLAPRRTTVDLQLGAAGLPADRLRLVVGTPAFERRVRVLAPASSDAWMTLAEGLIWRAARRADRLDLAGPEELEITVPLLGRREVRLEIDDGDDPPLELVEVWAGWPAQEVVLSASAAGPHRALVGAPGAAAPRYDLGGFLARSDGPPLGEARLGPLGPNHGHAPRPPPPAPFSERHRVALGAALAALIAGLALWAVALLRRASR